MPGRRPLEQAIEGRFGQERVESPQVVRQIRLAQMMPECRQIRSQQPAYVEQNFDLMNHMVVAPAFAAQTGQHSRQPIKRQPQQGDGELSHSPFKRFSCSKQIAGQRLRVSTVIQRLDEPLVEPAASQSVQPASFSGFRQTLNHRSVCDRRTAAVQSM